MNSIFTFSGLRKILSLIWTSLGLVESGTDIGTCLALDVFVAVAGMDILGLACTLAEGLNFAFKLACKYNKII